MKISVVIPVYNEEELIKNCLKSLISQDYPKKDYEIIVVNDGSTDKTKENIEKITKTNKKTKIRVINQKNKGRAITREIGAKIARYNNLFFMDARCRADKHILKNFEKINYQPIIGNVIFSNESFFDRFNKLIRKPIYNQGGYGEDYKKVYITKKNFDNIPKGTGVLFCNKNLFLTSKLKNKSKNISDDVKLFWNMIQKRKILKHPMPKVFYNSRSSLKKHIGHTFNRGPKFIDYYFKPGKKYFPHIITLLVGLIGLILLTVVKPLILIPIFIALGLGLILVSIILSKKSRDFFILIYLLPLTILAFSSGIIKGILLKLFGRY
jgi:glycosyltransferase involved in cell wall biosynthesis